MLTSNKLVSIIIVNWNGLLHLQQCLPAIYGQTYRDFEVIIVDNGSTDQSTSWVAANYPLVQVIKNKNNLGFAAANNIGINIAQGQYLVTLNNDTRPEPTWLAELVQGLIAPNIGMVASKMLIWDTPSVMDSAGVEVDWAGFGWNRGWKQPASSWNESHEVFGPCAGAALYRREMLSEIGLFDEDFFAYYEDIDLAWRAQLAGWKCWYAASAQVLHKHSATGQLLNRYKIFLLHRNRLWTIVKNYPSHKLWRTAPLIFLLDIVSAIYQVFCTRSLVSLKARWGALTGIKRMLNKRQSGAPVHLASVRRRI